jgi:hypothetical protein
VICHIHAFQRGAEIGIIARGLLLNFLQRGQRRGSREIFR